MLDAAISASTKGTEYAIAIAFLVVFIFFLRLFKTKEKK
jgi:hypothetical protein